MRRDDERVERVQRALQERGLDGIVCTLPANVLLLTGYWSVFGTSLAVTTRNGHGALIIPEDEQELAEQGWANEIRTFQSGSLLEIKQSVESLSGPLADTARSLGFAHGSLLGYENGPTFLALMPPCTSTARPPGNSSAQPFHQLPLRLPPSSRWQNGPAVQPERSRSMPARSLAAS
jgi:hypothetical protein